MPSAPRPMPGAPSLVVVAPNEGSPKTTVKPSAGTTLGLLSVIVKLSWMSPVEIRFGQTKTPIWLLVAAVNWKLQPDSATASPSGDQFESQRFGMPCSGPTNRPAETLVTEVATPWLSSTYRTEPEFGAIESALGQVE